MADELRQPLRRRRFGDRLLARRPSGLILASFALGLVVAAAGTWLARTPYPMAGEPVVTVKVAPPSDPIETASVASDEAPVEDVAVEDAPAEAEITIVGGEEASRQRPAREEVLIPAPQKTVSEKGPFGLLPRIGRSGQTAFNVYARGVDAGLLASNRPKVALLIGGMGLNSALTAKAIADLPADVSFAFAPYGEKLQRLVNKARAGGHEVFLQVPMEPFGYPTVNPGARTLLSSVDGNSNLENLTWFMGRFSGYVGISNYMGARFAIDDAALRPVLAELKKRGLVFLDDGSLSAGLATQLGRDIGLGTASASRVIDASTSFDDIIANLKILEDEARGGTIALGTGTGLASTIEAVAAWARDLGNRGVVLVPVSSLYRARSG
jgi:polysaccharide deacetylase 2 family uncharacterized protein YibQ